MGILEKLGLKAKQPSPQITAILPQEIYEAGMLELKDIIAPAALKISAREFQIGEKIARTFFVMSYPRFLNESWFSPVINLDKIFDIAIFVHPIDTAQVLRQFQKKVAEVSSQIHMREEKGLVRDPMLDTAYQDLEKLRDELQQAQEKLFDVGLYITMYAENNAELDKIESEIKSILESKLIYIKPALFQQEQGFRSTLPICSDELAVHSKLNSAPLSSIFPFVSFDLTSDRGILYGINRHNSSLVLFDRFSLENYNSITFAKSGSGKSIVGSEPVLIKEGNSITLKPIGEVIEELIKKYGARHIDEELEGVINPGIKVFSFDKERKGEWSTVSLAARKIAPDTFFRFETRSGRSVVTTGDHNILVLRDGDVVATKSADIKIGEHAPLPRKVSRPENTTDTLNLLELLKDRNNIYISGAAAFIKDCVGNAKANFDPARDRYFYKYLQDRRIPIKYFHQILKKYHFDTNDGHLKDFFITSASGKGMLPLFLPVSEAFMRLLGYITAEGTITNQCVIISNTDREVREDIMRSARGMNISFCITTTSINISSRPFVELTRVLGMKKYSAEKRVPSFIFNAQEHCVSAFLQTYFEGDGGVESSGVTAVSKSKELISDLSYLLFYFGIIVRIARTKKWHNKTGPKQTYWKLSIYGQEYIQSFIKNINFLSKRKQIALEGEIREKGNTNVDLIPGLSPVLKELSELLPGPLRGLRALVAIRNGAYNPSPPQLGNLVSLIEERLQSFKNMGKKVRVLQNMPELAELIKNASAEKETNALLWQELGSSWAYAKKYPHTLRFSNAQIIAKSAGESPLPESHALKEVIRDGVRELALVQKDISASLRSALTNINQNTSYELLYHAAHSVTEEYEKLLSRLPHIESIMKKLRTLVGADLFWDEIVSVEQIKNTSERYVYDLTVDNEVFLAGSCGLFIHNSYQTKLEILRTLMFDTEVIVIDPEREYEYMAEAVGGRYFNISLNSEHHINPFDLPAVREDESPSDVLRSNIVTLVGLFRIMLGGLSPEEDATIDRAITETYALKDITPDADFVNADPPLMSDFELVLSGMEGAETLVQKLSKFTRGTWAGFINKPSNVDINAKFIVFSLRDMEDELKPVAMYIVTHYIWNAIRKELKKRLMVIDEAWWMMRSEDTASFLLGLAKRGRKYFLGLATITQDVDDFLKSPYGLPILTNSSIQILLKQSPTSIDRLQQVFNLTEEEKYLLLESDVGEGMFFVGLKHVAIKIIASYTEDQIITSDPSQILAIKKAKQEHAAAGG